MAQRTTDPNDPTARTERERLYSQAQAILAIDVPWVPLAHSKVVFAAAERAARAGGAAVGDGPLPLGGARAMSPPDGGPDGRDSDGKGVDGRGAEGTGASEGKSGKVKRTSGLSRKLRSSSGNMRSSSIFRAAEWLGRGASVWSMPVSAVMRRRGWRRRLSAVLIVAALGPVIAVSAVAVLLIFSSVEQGIEFEALRGLQVARAVPEPGAAARGGSGRAG